MKRLFHIKRSSKDGRGERGGQFMLLLNSLNFASNGLTPSWMKYGVQKYTRFQRLQHINLCVFQVPELSDDFILASGISFFGHCLENMH